MYSFYYRKRKHTVVYFGVVYFMGILRLSVSLSLMVEGESFAALPTRVGYIIECMFIWLRFCIVWISTYKTIIHKKVNTNKK